MVECARWAPDHHHSSAHYGNKDAVRAVIVGAVAFGLAALAEITASLVRGSASVLALQLKCGSKGSDGCTKDVRGTGTTSVRTGFKFGFWLRSRDSNPEPCG